MIENDDEQTTVGDMVARMAEFCSKPYSVKFMRHTIKETLGEGVVITNINGRKDVVTVQAIAAQIPQQFHEKTQM